MGGADIISSVSLFDAKPVSVSQRQLSVSEARSIMEEIKKTPKITGYDQLEWTKTKPIFVAENGRGELLGACLIDDFHRQWTEIAVVYVLPSYRRMGIGRSLIEAAHKNISLRGRNALIFYSGTGVKGIVSDLGFQTSSGTKSLCRDLKQEEWVLRRYYPVRWLCNAYRIKEIVRKKFAFNMQLDFECAVSLTNRDASAAMLT